MNSKEKFVCRPIGIVHSPYKQRAGTPVQGVLAPDVEGIIEIFDEFAAGLTDIEGFSHIWVLYRFHLSKDYKLRVVPFIDDQERGLFSTRAPCRPNQIGQSLVRLLRREGSRLYISGIDIVDGTPVLDLKPYVDDFDRRKDARFGWLESIDAEDRKKRSIADERFVEKG